MNTESTLNRLAPLQTISFDLSDWSQIEVSGADALTFLQSFCTNDLSKLKPGQGCEAFLPNLKGRILGHVLVLVHDDRVSLLAVPGAQSAIVPHLQKYLIGREAEVSDQTEERGLLCLCGSQLAGELPDLFGTDLPQQMYDHRQVATQAGTLTMARVDLTNLPTVILSGNRDDVESFRECLPVELVGIGEPQLFDILRIEAGFPWHGQDISEAHLAQEAARTTQAISFTKGCYLGQEPIARLDALGHTNKELRGLSIDATDVPPGTPVFYEDRKVGQVTSAAYSPALKKTLALAMLPIAAANPEQVLQVGTPPDAAPAMVFWPRLAAR